MIDLPAAGFTVEPYHLARINPVRVCDFLLVHAPDLGPAPWLVEEGTGNAPQGIALDDGMAVRRIGLEFADDGLGLGRNGRHTAKQGGGQQAAAACAKIFH